MFLIEKLNFDCKIRWAKLHKNLAHLGTDTSATFLYNPSLFDKFFKTSTVAAFEQNFLQAIKNPYSTKEASRGGLV